jgi:dUTP pyrophosphatase
MKVKIINKSKHGLPLEYATDGSAGVDIRANESVLINKHTRALVKTGIYLEIPKGYEAQVRPRSGRALREGITVLNSPGTIDSDYRGEVGIILQNTSVIHCEIKAGERIAQIVFAKYEQAEFEEIEKLSDTKRSSDGFGSTGNN